MTMNYDQYANQLLNSVFENAKQSSSNNNWHLLEQLEEQKKLILEQQNLLRDLQSNIRQSSIPSPPSALIQNDSNNHDDDDDEIILLPQQQKPPAVPLPPQASQPVKRKSFLRRSLSRRNFKDQKQTRHPPTHTPPVQTAEPLPVKIQKIELVDQTPTFWKPRQERPKGWWKGNRGPVEDTYRPKRTTQPKKVPSLQGTKVRRPMAFKTPSIKKKKQVPRKKIDPVQVDQDDPTPALSTMPMPVYVMPQQPMYYQQPMMMAPAPYGMPIINTVSSPDRPIQDSSPPPPQAVKQKTSVLNPREHSNDKCSIM